MEEREPAGAEVRGSLCSDVKTKITLVVHLAPLLPVSGSGERPRFRHESKLARPCVTAKPQAEKMLTDYSCVYSKFSI